MVYDIVRLYRHVVLFVLHYKIEIYIRVTFYGDSPSLFFFRNCGEGVRVNVNSTTQSKYLLVSRPDLPVRNDVPDHAVLPGHPDLVVGPNVSVPLRLLVP